MANSFYNHGNAPSPGSIGSSATIRAEFDAVTAGFALFPTLAGFANKPLVVNSLGTAVTTTTGSLALAGALTTTGVFDLTLALGATVTMTLPLVSGTFATLAGTETLTNKTITAPVFSGTATGTYTLGGTPTITAPILSGTVTGTYTLGGTPTGSLVQVLATGTTTARSLATRFSEMTNVKDLGALGDGSTDDTAAFILAEAIGGYIFVPAGTYIIDNVPVTNGFLMVGEGDDSILKKKNNSVSTSYSNALSYLFDITNANITVEFADLVFDGNYQGQVTTRSAAIPGNTSATAIQNFVGTATVIAVGGAIKTLQATAALSTDRLCVRVRNCTIQHCVTIGCYFAGTISVGALAEFLVEGCTFRSFSAGVSQYHDGVTPFSGVVYPAGGYSFSANGSNACAIYAADAARLRVVNNTFIETRDPFAGTVTTGYDTNLYNFPMCALTITTDDGTTQGDPLDWSHLIFTGNMCTGCGRYEFCGNTIGVVDFYVRGGNTVVSGNSFYNNWSTAIRGKTNAKQLSISSNVIENLTSINSRALGINIGPPTYPSQQGNYSIVGNTIRNATTGILVTGDSGPPEDTDGTVADDTNDAQISTAVGATTDATGYTTGLKTVTLASAGTGDLVVGDLITFAGDTTQYVITVGDGDVSDGGTISFHPGLVSVIPAATTAITVVVIGKYVNNIVVANNIVENSRNVSLVDATLQSAFDIYGQGIYVKQASSVAITGNVVDTTSVPTSGTTETDEHGIFVSVCRNVVITGNRVRRSSRAGLSVESATGDVVVSGNLLSRSAEEGMTVTNTGNTSIVNNVVATSNGTGILSGSSTTRNLLIANNRVENVLGDSASTIVGISTGGAIVAKSVSITGNTIELVTNAGAGNAYGVYAQLAATPDELLTTHISDNTIYTTDQSGMFLQDVTGVVYSNIFKNCNTSLSTAQGGIFINGVTNVGKLQIAGNTHTSDMTLFPTTGGASWATIAAHTIATGVVTVLMNSGTVLIDTEAAAATDDLDTINNLQDGSITTFRAVSSARDVVFKDGTGNMKLNGDFTLNNVEDQITLRMSNSVLYEMSRSDNGA